ncbi:hypothetical protein [Paracoccus versutus]|uniref:hypothetical protein n=1 Tax=Paracoccus versutus TaxID=34007 RepID=UPI000DF7E835|nr:hypothetical protein [Paracoccus versutus]RDD72835.1 hypothetical protein DVR11_02580 [Paracoccus versutus]
MIPTVHQIQSRAGPAATQAAREVEIVGPTLARAQPEVPAVEESGGVGQDMQLGRQGIDHSRQAASAQAVQGGGSAASAAEDADGPQDRAVFRAKVIRFLTAIYGDDESFQRALKLGTIVIRAVEDQPEPEMRPELSHATYRHGAAQAQQARAATERRGGGPPPNVAAGDFVAWWPK